MLVREVFRKSTGLNRAEDFKNYKPATDDQAAQCGNPDGEKPLPGVSPFYFGKGFKTSMWNDMLLRGLVADLQRMRAEDPSRLGIPDVSTDYLIALFLNCVKEGRYTWARQQPRLGESETAAQARAQQFDQATKMAKLSRTRKETKWKKRWTTAKRMTLLCRGNPDAVNIWKWVKRLLELLGALGMSSEDTKPYKVRFGGNTVTETTHVIKICSWRPKKVTDALELVDYAAEDVSMKRGIAGRSRLRAGPISQTSAPQGLPEALYDEEWMAEGLEMDPGFRDDLKVSEEAFEILELAAAELGVPADDDADDDDDVNDANDDAYSYAYNDANSNTNNANNDIDM